MLRFALSRLPVRGNFIFLLLFVAVFPETSYAYLDPGSGNALVYLVISLTGAALYFAKNMFYQVVRLFSSKERLEMRVAKAQANEVPPLALFSEGSSYWTMFKPLIEELLRRKIPFQYYSMDVHDPALTIDEPLMHSSFLGFGSVAYPRLSRVKAKVLIVTTPNIGTPGYPMPRPKDVEKLVYVQHGIDDATYLKKGSLDHYDVDMEAGPWCERAIRELERQRGLTPKEFYSMGVLYLDEMIRECQEKDNEEFKAKRKNTVLVAPSWGPKSCLNVYGTAFIDDLLQAGFNVILRPHPQSFKVEKRFITDVIERFKGRITVDRSSDFVETMLSSGVLVSDASSIRMDFAFTQNRPVITLSVPLKDLKSFEADTLGPAYTETIAKEIGLVIHPGENTNVVKAVQTLINDDSKTREIRELFQGLVANQGCCAKAIVDWAENQLHLSN